MMSFLFGLFWHAELVLKALNERPVEFGLVVSKIDEIAIVEVAVTLRGADAVADVAVPADHDEDIQRWECRLFDLGSATLPRERQAAEDRRDIVRL